MEKEIDYSLQFIKNKVDGNTAISEAAMIIYNHHNKDLDIVSVERQFNYPVTRSGNVRTPHQDIVKVDLHIPLILKAEKCVKIPYTLENADLTVASEHLMEFFYDRCSLYFITRDGEKYTGIKVDHKVDHKVDPDSIEYLPTGD